MVKSRLGHHTEVGVHAAHGHVICQSANLSLLAALDVVLPQEVHVRKRRHYWMQRQTFLGEFSTGKIWKWMMVQVHLRLARMKKSMILKIFWNLRLVITREINKKRHFQIYLITFFHTGYCSKRLLIWNINVRTFPFWRSKYKFFHDFIESKVFGHQRSTSKYRSHLSNLVRKLNEIIYIGNTNQYFLQRPTNA